MGNYPIEASPDVDPRTQADEYKVATHPDVATLRERAEAQAEGALWLLDRPVNIGFGAFHGACNPYREHTAYTIPPPTDMEGWASWVLHLEEKTWMGRRDLMRMLDFWWGHKGQRPPDLI